MPEHSISSSVHSSFACQLVKKKKTCSSISCSWSLNRKRFPSANVIRYVGFLLKRTILAKKHVLALYSSYFQFFRLVSFHVDGRCRIIFAFCCVHDEQISKPIYLRV